MRVDTDCFFLYCYYFVVMLESRDAQVLDGYNCSSRCIVYQKVRTHHNYIGENSCCVVAVVGGKMYSQTLRRLTGNSSPDQKEIQVCRHHSISETGRGARVFFAGTYGFV